MEIDDNDYYIVWLIQYLNDRNAATPLFIQWDSYFFVGNNRSITKLVECPVVDNVPTLDTTL